ncbi:MAG: DUF2059 domain-containing protein [Alphaproteobacteria bacterium]|nr:DUF2059 domain-containing protein [Alphaproteobacteria bacterium]MBV8548322.1 DUF2059 domain-containing protein [Alphaproteobacteria bacterium]
MKLKTFLCMLALTSILSLGIAQADDAVTTNGTAALTDESLATARELMSITKSDEVSKQVLPILMKSYANLMVRDNPEKAQQVSNLLSKFLIPEFTAHMDELRDHIAHIYAANLSVGDMQNMIAFYKSPTGQTVLSKLPVIMQQTLQISSVWGKEVAAAATLKLIEEMRKNNLNVPKEMAL